MSIAYSFWKVHYNVESLYLHTKVINEALPAGGPLQEVIHLTLEGSLASTSMITAQVTAVEYLSFLEEGPWVQTWKTIDIILNCNVFALA